MSPGEAFAAVLERYGERVKVCRGEEECGESGKAFVQPLRQERQDPLPTPLGGAPQGRWRYLGHPQLSLEGIEAGYILWQGEKFEVVNACPVYLGGQVNHWRAILTRRDPDAGGI